MRNAVSVRIVYTHTVFLLAVFIARHFINWHFHPLLSLSRINSIEFLKTIDIYLYYNYNISMEVIKFEWDKNKNELNQKKHKISFEEAKTVFYDEEALLIDDPEHSQEEARFIILGFSKRANLLVVCHCYRASESVIRIISARKATKNEAKQYYE